MPYSSHWNMADIFTVEQAAYLWCDQEPRMITTDFAGAAGPKAVFQTIVGAIKRGDLAADHSTNTLVRIGEYRTSMVSRDALVRYARSKNAFPGFLFDTLGPSNEELAQQFMKSTPPGTDQATVPDPASSAESADTEKSRGGRPEGYDWNACTAEIIRLADVDGLPSVQNDLVRHLSEWFDARFGKCPADSVLRSRISPIYAYLKNVGWKPKNG